MEQVFSQRLRSARIMRGFSMDELCETMGASVSKQAISKYEKGKMLPNSTVLIQLANVLCVSIDYFSSHLKFSWKASSSGRNRNCLSSSKIR